MLINRADCTLAYTQSQAAWWSLLYHVFWQRVLRPSDEDSWERDHVLTGNAHVELQSPSTLEQGRRIWWSLGITVGHCSLNTYTGKLKQKPSLPQEVFTGGPADPENLLWNRPCHLQLAIHLWNCCCKVYWSSKAFKHSINLLDFIYILKVQQVLKGFVVLKLAAP